jgi:hypothetical protein
MSFINSTAAAEFSQDYDNFFVYFSRPFVVHKEPIKVLDSTTAETALIKIYNRGILSQPKIIQSDSGSEFKGAFNDYLQDKDIMHITAPANRHRMVAIVENKNKLLGRLIFHLLNYKDLVDERNRREEGGRRRPKRKDKGATDWYVNNESFRQLIHTVNEMNNFEPITEAKSDDLKITRGNKNILPVGTRVYVALDQPEEITNAPVFKNFTESDVGYQEVGIGAGVIFCHIKIEREWHVLTTSQWHSDNK